MEFVLWILAVILVISGILAITRKQVLWGVVLIVVGLLVGPGGVSLFDDDDDDARAPAAAPSASGVHASR